MSFVEGEVKWFSNDRGYGFVHPVSAGNIVDESVEYFVHFSSVNMDGFKTLAPRQRVTFVLKETDKGTQAVEVTPL